MDKATKSSSTPINAASDIDEVILGHVLCAGVGQSPATQALLYAGLPSSIPTTSVNKVCASGMKAIALATNAIKSGESSCIIAGGMESMSQVPFALPQQLRCSNTGLRFGHPSNVDLLIKDGLTDAMSQQLMGECAEHSAASLNITRDAMDDFAKRSFERAITTCRGVSGNDAVSLPFREHEIIAVKRKTTTTTTTSDSDLVEIDEGINMYKPDKMPNLKPVFWSKEKGGRITAATSSQLTDGACAFVLCSGAKANALGIEQPLAKIIACADASMDPIDFTIAPSKAIEKVLVKSQWTLNDVDLFEINEAFAVTPLANAQLLNISLDKINVLGGAIALGHPLGCSGSRVVGTLITALKVKGLKRGCASICNGGGGATAITIELL